MKVVSFDIGIRNLAYCVLDGTSRNDVKIVDWNIIDLLSEQAGVEATRCHKCPAAASWSNVGEGVAACSKHKPKSAKKVTKKDMMGRTLESLQQELRTLNQEVATSKAKCVNLLFGWRKQHAWIRSVKSSHSGSVLDLSSAIVSAIDKRSSSWKGSDIVAFENQLDRRMFAVQGMLHMLFTSRGFRCQGVSATHKLTNMLTVEDTTSSYKGRKKTGIAHATALVPEVWKAHMLGHPKKDDLADSFLQGLWVLEHSHPR
jgi:hypothetical protein